MLSSSLDLVVPCYNPAPGWAQNIVQNFSALQALLPEIPLHLIVVNDGSKKGISETDIEYLKANITHLTYLSYEVNCGKGYALRTGVAASKGPYCLYTDVDFPYELASIAKVFSVLYTEQADIAIGIRDADYYAHVPATRTKISKVLKALTRNLLHLPIQDTQCGLKGFNRKGRAVFLKTEINRYLFDLEFIFLASKLPLLSMKPVEVQLKPDIIFSKMNFKILLRESYSFTRILIKTLSRSA